MIKFTENIEYYIDQYNLEKQVYGLHKNLVKRGYINKPEFLKICLWKSRRPKTLYFKNSEEDIIKKSRAAFNENDELIKIRYLVQLKGVRIATASAILSVYNPMEYPIIDERCIQALRDLKAIDWKTITEKNWIKYLNLVRDLAIKNQKTAREIEKGLFAYNRINLDNNFINLYK